MKRTLSCPVASEPEVEPESAAVEPQSRLDEFKAGWTELKKQIQDEQKQKLDEMRPLIKAERTEFKLRIEALVKKLEFSELSPQERDSCEKELAGAKVELRKKEGGWDAVQKCKCSGAEAELYKKHSAALLPHVPPYMSKFKDVLLPKFDTRSIQSHDFMDRDSYRLLHERVSDFVWQLKTHWRERITVAVDECVFANYDAKAEAKTWKLGTWPKMLPAPLGGAVLEDVQVDVGFIRGEIGVCVKTLRAVLREHREEVYKGHEEYMSQMFALNKEDEELQDLFRTYKGETFLVVSESLDNVVETETVLAVFRKASHAIRTVDAAVRCGGLGLKQFVNAQFWLRKLDEEISTQLEEYLTPEDDVDLWENCMARKAGCPIFIVRGSEEPLYVSYGCMDYVGTHAVETAAKVAAALGVAPKGGVVEAKPGAGAGAAAGGGGTESDSDSDFDSEADVVVVTLPSQPKRQKRQASFKPA